MPTYNDIIESFINGQYNQAWEMFNQLGQWEMSGFTAQLISDEITPDADKIKYLAFLLDRKISN